MLGQPARGTYLLSSTVGRRGINGKEVLGRKKKRADALPTHERPEKVPEKETPGGGWEKGFETPTKTKKPKNPQNNKGGHEKPSYDLGGASSIYRNS